LTWATGDASFRSQARQIYAVFISLNSGCVSRRTISPFCECGGFVKSYYDGKCHGDCIALR
jgi:hypothetical protein